MLPRTQQIFLKLWSDKKMAFEEIADVYGISEDEVEDIIRRAIAKYDEFARQPRRNPTGKGRFLPIAT